MDTGRGAAPATAVLLMDLQVDFLDAAHGRLPVPAADAAHLVEAAGAVLGGRALAGAWPALVLNAFSPADRIANRFRRGAAVAGTPGAAPDPRLALPAGLPVFTKARSSAFANPALEPWLRAFGVRSLWLFGVFAEGCVRATALDARRLGFEVTVPRDLIASNARWKRRVAEWSLRRAGVRLVEGLPPRA